MTHHTAVITWERRESAFLENRYSRGHRWLFDGGVEVAASSSPSVIPVPLSVAEAVDPEEAFVASLASCHMLWFLAIAVKRKMVVDAYRDEAVGVVSNDESGKLAVTRVTLRPEARFGGDRRPSTDEVIAMHDEAHGHCFIANSVTQECRVRPIQRAGTCPFAQGLAARR